MQKGSWHEEELFQVTWQAFPDKSALIHKAALFLHLHWWLAVIWKLFACSPGDVSCSAHSYPAVQLCAQSCPAHITHLTQHSSIGCSVISVSLCQAAGGVHRRDEEGAAGAAVSPHRAGRGKVSLHGAELIW